MKEWAFVIVCFAIGGFALGMVAGFIMWIISTLLVSATGAL